MNERVKELAEQAGFKKQEHFYDTWECSNTNIEMFADYVRYDETKACAKHYLEIMRDAVEQARADEREAWSVQKFHLENDLEKAQDLLNEYIIRQRGEK